MQEFRVIVPFDLDGYIAKCAETESYGQLWIMSKAEKVELQVFDMAVSDLPLAVVTLPPVEAKRLAEILPLALTAHTTKDVHIFAATQTVPVCDQKKKTFGGELTLWINSCVASLSFHINQGSDWNNPGVNFFRSAISLKHLPLLSSALKIAAEIAEENRPC